MAVSVHHADMLAWLAAYDGPLFDSCVTDPPYHLTSIVKRFGADNAAPAKAKQTGAYERASRGFMGKQWDGGDIAFRPETWRAVYDRLKPGAHLVAFSGTRTYHRMACAIEDAGFEIRDQLQWLYGSGFPKSHNQKGDWEGWGTALKPACEPICLARKPLSEKTVAANVLKWGTGALNIDGCRVGDFVNATPPGTDRYNASNHRQGYRSNAYGRDGEASAERRYGADGATNFNPLPGHRGGAPEGRWPANVLHDGGDEVLGTFPDAPGAFATVTGNEPSSPFANVYGDMPNRAGSAVPRGDEGSAARFFYSAKAGPLDRIGTKHATVKPVDLMRWLTRLVTPPGGHILDPFAGSGTTGIAAMVEGFDSSLIELEAEHFADIERKLAYLRGEGAVTMIEHNRHRQPEEGGGLPLFAA